jgi:hypothetical protein
MNPIASKISPSNVSNLTIKWSFVIPGQLITWLVLFSTVEMLSLATQIKRFRASRLGELFNLSIGVPLVSNWVSTIKK